MSKKTAHLLWFEQVNKKDIPLVGGKGANLGEMVRAGIPVPNGFCVTATAYYDFLKTTSLKQKILTELSGLDRNDSKKLQQASKSIKTAILAAKMPDDLAGEIKEYYHNLCGIHDRLVAVRSSATAEDLPDASFAGQQETYLNIIGYQDVVKHVQKCWASLFESRAIFYREEKGFNHFKIGIAVPVQLMVQSEISGIMFTVNPLTNNRDEVSVEAAYGLGQPVVSGEVTPDQYIVNKTSGKIVSKYISNQTWQMTLDGNVPVSKKYQKTQKMSNRHVVQLAKLGVDIEKHYGRPQDMEWGMEGGKLYIVQSRPITTLIAATKTEVAILDASKKPKLLLEGLAASPGIATGTVRILKSASQISLIKDGDILVAKMTNPDYVPAMRRATAIVTDEGGRTSHAAIVSRELGVPAVVGTVHATSMLRNGEEITVDGAQGKIYEGNITKTIEVEQEVIDPKTQKTATKVYLNLAEPELAADMAIKNVDGIGLLRAEFMIANIGKHPKAFIKEKKQKEFIADLTDGLEKFSKAF
ncbi:phosphoenolpyruvate synthase, partial [Patescibacteria group bacterium]|nr:phosphoenolpyruvate synthase [Patescibacteria group bacterium]